MLLFLPNFFFASCAEDPSLSFGCPPPEVDVVYNNSEMFPVLSDHFDMGCALATEEQVDGLYGGDPTALTDMYYNHILVCQK